MRDATAGTSLLQSLAEIDHRDRNHHHHPNHKHLHPRQVDAAIQVDGTVTAVTSTVSVIQDIIIDSNGSTVQVQTWLAASTSVAAPPDSTVPAPTVVDAITTPAATIPYTSTDSGAPLTDLIGASTNAQLTLAAPISQASPSTSAPYLSTNSSITTGSSSLSSSSFPTYTSNLSNYTTSLTSLSSESRTSFSTSSDFSDSLSSTSLSAESYYISDSPTPTVAGGAGGGNRPAATSSISSTSTAGAGTGSSTSDVSTSPSTPAVVGGVVGGVAGIVFIVALLMVLVRWRKRRQNLLRLGDSPTTEPPAIGGSSGGPSQPSGMIEKSLPFAIPAALASLTGHKRASQQPSVGASSMAGSERGFYRVSGRKLPSVFQHGGDGYGGGYEAGHESLSGSSFYRDSRGFYGGPGSPTSPLAGRDSGIPITRPSPARTPIISEGAFGPPSPAPPPPIDPLRRPDALGRSHPSRDGSRGSRFTEEV